MHWLDFTVIALYMLAVAGIGVYTSRLIRGTDDFFLGGRKFGRVFTIFLQFGTGTSSDMPVSVSRESFRNGMSGIWAVLLWLFITPFYWIIGPWYRRMRMVTIGDYFTARFDSKALGAAYAAFSVFYFMYYIAIGLTAVGKTVEILTPVPESAYTESQARAVEGFRRLTFLEQEVAAGRELNAEQASELERLRPLEQEGRLRSHFSYFDSRAAVPVIAVVILIYAILGGLKAAVITDFVQGVLIIVLSFVIIPFGLARTGWFSGLHERVPEHMFNLLGSPQTSDYSLLFVCAIILVNLVGIVVQPHMIQVCGSARDENAARVGLTYGNYLKRVCTIGWALVGVLVYALYASEVSDPDMVWGYATLKLLPVGVVGLMIASMLAAIMSSADAFMVSGSALFTMNLYRPLRPHSTDRHLVWVGRITTAFIIIGGVLLSQMLHSVIELLKYIWTLPVIFGAAFWLSFLWRRVTLAAAWSSVAFSMVFSFILPVVLPLSGSLATNPGMLIETAPLAVEVRVGAGSQDVAAGLASREGELIVKQQPVPSTPVYFQELGTSSDGSVRGSGKFRLGIRALSGLGCDFRESTRATLEAVTYLLDAVLPFLVLFVVSLVTRPVDRSALERFYARIHTPVRRDPNEDSREVELSLADPHRHDSRRLLPGTHWMMLKPDRSDIMGFVAATVVALAIVGLVFLVAGITWP
jgi:SSS family solute:Na+ symporter